MVYIFVCYAYVLVQLIANYPRESLYANLYIEMFCMVLSLNNQRPLSMDSICSVLLTKIVCSAGRHRR